jgi:hypothetical protein
VDELLALRGKLRGSSQPQPADSADAARRRAPAPPEALPSRPPPQPSARRPRPRRAAPDRDALLARLHDVQAQLVALQGEHP